MRKLVLSTVLFCLFISCSKDADFDASQFPQKWQLVKMTGSKLNWETTGADMEWQEFYFFKSDGTFIKSRERNGKISEAFGNFAYKDLADGKYIELSYQTNFDIISSCYSNQAESLWLISENKLIGTWSHCDGPGLEYERVE